MGALRSTQSAPLHSQPRCLSRFLWCVGCLWLRHCECLGPAPCGALRECMRTAVQVLSCLSRNPGNRPTTDEPKRALGEILEAHGSRSMHTEEGSHQIQRRRGSWNSDAGTASAHVRRVGSLPHFSPHSPGETSQSVTAAMWPEAQSGNTNPSHSSGVRGRTDSPP
jgi:hypothetical protein